MIVKLQFITYSIEELEEIDRKLPLLPEGTVVPHTRDSFGNVYLNLKEVICWSEHYEPFNDTYLPVVSVILRNGHGESLPLLQVDHEVFKSLWETANCCEVFDVQVKNKQKENIKNEDDKENSNTPPGEL